MERLDVNYQITQKFTFNLDFRSERAESEEK